jgi:hypothetical protein
LFSFEVCLNELSNVFFSFVFELIGFILEYFPLSNFKSFGFIMFFKFSEFSLSLLSLFSLFFEFEFNSLFFENGIRFLTLELIVVFMFLFLFLLLNSSSSFIIKNVLSTFLDFGFA